MSVPPQEEHPARQSPEIETITDHSPEPFTPSETTGQYPAVRRGGGGCGCWIPVLLASFVATLLVIGGLFLPPINLYDRLFGTQYEYFGAQRNALEAGNLTLVLDEADMGEKFGAVLEAISLDQFINGTAQTAEWIPTVRAAVPPYLALQSEVYSLQTTGTAPETLNFIMNRPAGLNPDLLDVYGWDNELSRWVFLPSQPNTAGKLTVTTHFTPAHLAVFQSGLYDAQIVAPIDVKYELTADVAQVASIVAPAGLQPNPRGELVGSLAPGFTVTANYRVMPVIRNFLDDAHVLDLETVNGLLSNPGARAAHIQQITGVAANSGYDGVFIDYRGLSEESREDFSAFIAALKASFRDYGLTLGVVVPAAENRDGSWQTGAYDWRIIGQHADYVQINLPEAPPAFATGEDRLVEAMFRWAVGEVSRYKLVGGLGALSAREVNGVFSPIGYAEALSGLGNVTINAERTSTGSVQPGTRILASLDGLDALPGLDTMSNTPFVDYLATDGSTVSRVWLTTPDALNFRMRAAANFALGGVTLNDLPSDGITDGILAMALDYRLQMPVQTSPTELALRWRVENANGTVSEIITALNEDLEVTLEAEGNFAVNVEVVDEAVGFSSARSGAAVAVFAPTSTPTPLPTLTPTLIPSPTPTLEILIPTSTPNPQAPPGGGNVGGSQPPGVAPGPGSIAGGFEYGGHVTSAASETAVSAMHRSGMTWMKVQVRYAPGADPGGAITEINNARARGFKILVGTVGSPSDLAAGGGGYIEGFANWLGGIAGAGPEAIEVWNEPNIDREWPRNTISGANYTAMLGAAYQAIKRVNPGVMVISAALAPTGAEAVLPGQVVNDDNFLAQMMAAGAINYLDCVGVHYNEGIVSPRQTSGDPRDSFYSRYYQTMENLYWNATGGQKPLCFTELGYLSPEGYGGLSDYWGWGRNTSVQQHASWLAEAISIASRSGRVRLLIVWNVDFTAYDANDPQGGFAMVRPGGGCPACDAIASAR